MASTHNNALLLGKNEAGMGWCLERLRETAHANSQRSTTLLLSFPVFSLCSTWVVYPLCWRRCVLPLCSEMIGCVAMLFSLLSWLPIHSGHSVRNQDYSSSSQLQNEKYAPAHGINNRAVPPRRTKRELLLIWKRPCHHVVRGIRQPLMGSRCIQQSLLSATRSRQCLCV